MHLSERSLAGAKCLKYSCLSDSAVVVAHEILRVFRGCGGGRGHLLLKQDFDELFECHVFPQIFLIRGAVEFEKFQWTN